MGHSTSSLEGNPSDPPQNPAGEYVPEECLDARRRDELITVIAEAPANLRKLVNGLRDDQLDARYRNWTIRQIVHHLADSHVNSYIRFKWALTEDRPTIKAYDEGRWAALANSRSSDNCRRSASINGQYTQCRIFDPRRDPYPNEQFCSDNGDDC